MEQLDFILKIGTAWDGLEQLLLFFSRWKAQSRGLALGIFPIPREIPFYPSLGVVTAPGHPSGPSKTNVEVDESREGQVTPPPQKKKKIMQME